MKKDASPLIEAHILLGEEPFHWRLAAMADIEAIAAYIPLRLHQLAMQPGRFGGARKAGWACGDAPYLTWFDPDDRYPQKEAVDFFSRAACALDDTPNLAVVCSAEQQIDAEGRLFGRPQIAPPDQPKSAAAQSPCMASSSGAAASSNPFLQASRTPIQSPNGACSSPPSTLATLISASPPLPAFGGVIHANYLALLKSSKLDKETVQIANIRIKFASPLMCALRL